MVISQRDVCWAALGDAKGSSAAGRRPVVVVQGDAFNASRISTALVVPLTSNLGLAAAPGNVVVEQRRSGLSRDSVANVSLLASIDRSTLDERVGQVSESDLSLILSGIDLVLGRD